MNFQNLNKIENSKFYLDTAINAAKKRAAIYKRKIHTQDKISKSKQIELERINFLTNNLVDRFNFILKSYPKIEELPPFYKELVKTSLDADDMKLSLGSINWTVHQVQKFFKIYNKKIKYSNSHEEITRSKKEFYGRVSSVVDQIDKHLINLENCRKILKKFPTIKTSQRTIAITGFPNTGKTTLLFKLTGSKPEIKNYAFTTIRINVAYLKTKEKIQILDTPGSLNRFNKMNPIEKQSFLVLKYLAEKIIYVFDLTESYPIEDQVKLFNETVKNHKEIIIYFSKTDLYPKERLDNFIKTYKKYKTFTDSEELKKEIK